MKDKYIMYQTKYPDEFGRYYSYIVYDDNERARRKEMIAKHNPDTIFECISIPELEILDTLKLEDIF